MFLDFYKYFNGTNVNPTCPSTSGLSLKIMFLQLSFKHYFSMILIPESKFCS